MLGVNGSTAKFSGSTVEVSGGLTIVGGPLQDGRATLGVAGLQPYIS
ncbi:hypothetical protein [Streptomyces sp. NPDC085665]